MGNGTPDAQAGTAEFDLLCFSHLRWDFVYQRPQHLMSRCARARRVFYVEEPEVDAGPNRLLLRQDESGVQVAVPYLDEKLSKEEGRATVRVLVDQLLAEQAVARYVAWYYAPMALAYTAHLDPLLVVYDCMDELSAFNGAPKSLVQREAELLRRADIVFAGGASLYEAKRNLHPNVRLFPSSVDVAHFARARERQADPADQAGIPHPRLGYFGVVDERMDLDLLAGLADSRPEWQLVVLGPLAKVEPTRLPRRPNVHYLGRKPYADLPAYLAGWDVALLPFAQNRSTRFVSPTKVPEYLAGGRPVVATPIHDVVRPYGEQGLVWIADGVVQFVRAVEGALALNQDRAGWLQQVDALLARNSWDRTWAHMDALIVSAVRSGRGHAPTEAAPETTTEMPVQPPTALPAAGGDGGPLPQLAVAPPRSDGRRAHGRDGGFDCLIVGAGFAGSVLAERLARGSGWRVLLIDKRPHVGGNAYDRYDEAGLLVHQYGPHIFHTGLQEVFDYLSRFTPWRTYEHRVRASVDGQLLPIPINLDTVNRLYGSSLSTFEMQAFLESVVEARDPLRTAEDVVVSRVGRELYEKFFRNYTRKQWGRDPAELDASVTARVPVRLNRDDRYFTDTYQCMPRHGFTRMFENMLDHPRVKLMLNTGYREVADLIPHRTLIYTGPLDEYFDYCYGKLPYRSLRFRFETLEKPLHQPVAVVNYPNEHPYTRVTEFKHLTGQEHPKTGLVYEYPCDEGDPYYPIPCAENARLRRRYQALADAARGVHFAGRLGTYQYYNMDQVVAQALALYARIAGLHPSESTLARAPGRFAIGVPRASLVVQG